MSCVGQRLRAHGTADVLFCIEDEFYWAFLLPESHFGEEAAARRLRVERL
jgi:hypothetical protein